MNAEAFGLPLTLLSGVACFQLDGEWQTELEGDLCFRHEKWRCLLWKTAQKRDEVPIERRVEVRLIRLEDKVTVIATDVTELKSEVKSLRTRMEDGFQSLRDAMNDGDQTLRKEMTDGFQSVRKEMTDGFQSVRKDITDAKIWALLLAAATLGVLARGFHWI